MSDTVLGFWDFFWIWWIVAILGGGSSYISRNTASDERIDALQKQVAMLTDEIRGLKGGSQQI